VLGKVRSLPWQQSLKMLDRVYDLHAHLADAGYIAVDFWDGNVMIDFLRSDAVVCDIDLYRRKPARNDRGRMPGSSRFLSPEEYTLGAALDESTTVFAMGALAFEFYGDNHYRSRQDWAGPPALYEVARRATQEKRERRYPSLRSFLQEWRGAVGLIPLGEERLY
jgi:serine/threonine-protein kinase